MQPLYVAEGVCRASDDEVLAEHVPRLADGHIVLAEVYAVGLQFLGQADAVVDYEHGLVLLAERLDGSRSGPHLVVGRALHAQLNPLAAALQGHACAIDVAETLVTVGYKLYWYHTFSIFSGLKKWFTGPCPCPISTPLPALRASVT